MVRPETAPSAERPIPLRPVEATPFIPEGGGRPSRGRGLAALRFDGLFWRRFAQLGSVYGPEWWKRHSPPFFAAAIFAVAHRNRRGAAACQARVLGHRRPGFDAYVAALRMFSTFAHCMTETMEFYGPRPRPFRIDEPQRNVVAEVLGRGHGLVLATAHVGNWDVSARALQAAGRPVNLVMAREPNETTQDYVRRTREQDGVRVILSDSSVFSAFNMIRALRRNEILAIQIDRAASGPMAPAGLRSVPFLGEEAPFLEGPFHLARLSGAPVIPVFTMRRGTRHYQIVLGEPRYVSRTDTADPARALRETVALLERTIRQSPDQWFQFAPLWHDRPEA